MDIRARFAMKITTYEGTVENGQIKLSEPVHLPEHTKVYVVVPGVETPSTIHIYSPRLANPQQAVDFTMDVSEGPPDAGLR
jgi:hypothetical protein